jgi:uncharacterized membrane protein YccC
MPTIERRYEAAVAVVDELRHFCVRLALALAAHHPEAKKTLDRLRRDQVNAAFRVGGDDPTVKSILEELDQALATVRRLDPAAVAETEARYSAHRNLGTRAHPDRPKLKGVVLKVVKED